jgi:AraC-like DNA-binding protein
MHRSATRESEYGGWAVTQVVDTRTMPAKTRADTVRAMARSIVPVELDFPDGSPVVRGSVTDLGSLRLTSIASNATKVERTTKLARDEMLPSVMLGLQLSGTSLVIQDGREAVVRPGDLVLYRSTSPYTLIDPNGYRQHQVRMPLERLALPRDVIGQVTAVKLAPGHPVADLTSVYFGHLSSRSKALSDGGGDMVSQPGIELIRAVIGTHLDTASATATEALHATLQLRILEYARAHLGDPDLNAAQIAAEHHISVRHLYNVLAGGGISLGDWIRSRRLEGCRADLERTGTSEASIASVAQRWGFRNASNFGRVFRADCGLSPREWRHAASRTGDARQALPSDR